MALANPYRTVPHYNTSVFLHMKTMQLTYLGHSAFLAAIGTTRVLFDPFIRPNPLAKDIDVDAIEADYILLSHAHGDHIADAEEIAKRTGAREHQKVWGSGVKQPSVGAPLAEAGSRGTVGENNLPSPR